MVPLFRFGCPGILCHPLRGNDQDPFNFKGIIQQAVDCSQCAYSFANLSPFPGKAHKRAASGFVPLHVSDIYAE